MYEHPIMWQVVWFCENHPCDTISSICLSLNTDYYLLCNSWSDVWWLFCHFVLVLKSDQNEMTKTPKMSEPDTNTQWALIYMYVHVPSLRWSKWLFSYSRFSLWEPMGIQDEQFLVYMYMYNVQCTTFQYRWGPV